MLKFNIKKLWDKLWGQKLVANKTPENISMPETVPTAFNSRATGSRRQEDMSAEGQLAVFLDKYLYERFPNKELFQKIGRVHNRELQLCGVDVQFVDQNNRIFNVDEKAQLYYLNKGLPTFAFEIEFLRHGISTTGWLCNDSLLTDFYLLIWPYASQDSPKNIRWYQFEKAECLLIQKKKLLRMLQNLGLSQEQLKYDAEKIRKRKQFGKQPIAGVNGIYYYASEPEKYSEAPINLVINKSRLTQIATKEYIVTKDNVMCN